MQPVWVTELDVVAPPLRMAPTSTSPSGDPYRRARVLVRCRTEPVGMLTLELNSAGDLDVAEVLQESERRFGPSISSILRGEVSRHPGLSSELQALSDRDGLPAISVVIGTRNRPDHIVECVDRVLKQDYPAPFEVLIVDNGASSCATADAIEVNYGHDPRVHYLAESRPGLSRARNIGLAAARYPITAFLSDDIRVEPQWMLTIARGFGRDGEVKAVTGICPPVYLDTAEQIQFEVLMAWGTKLGFRPLVHDLASGSDRLHPYTPGGFSNGSNMAFDTALFRQVGGFDEKLGPGTPSRGGEDLDASLQVFYQGAKVAYEPSMLGWHADRQDERPFTTLLYVYGLGLTAFLTKHLLDRRSRPILLRRIPHGLRMMVQSSRPVDADLAPGMRPAPAHRVAHGLGRLAGPVAYFRSRRAA